jgi:hypothetical protein
MIGINAVMLRRFGHDFVIQRAFSHDDFGPGAGLGVVAAGQ